MPTVKIRILMITVLIFIFVFLINNISNESDNRIITTLKYSSKKYARPTVVNGVPAKWGQMPYIVSIKEQLLKVSKLKKIWSNICGGTIIGPITVLTAAHCFEPKNFYYKKHPEKLRVVAGEFLTQLIHTGNTYTSDECQWRKITKLTIHPDFYFPENDIALVLVNEPWVYKENVNYILPATRRIDYPLGCTAAGFGSIADASNRQRISPVLLVGQMFLMPKKNCSSIWEMNMDKFICTYSYMSDVSYGDSGGPLVCKGTKDPAERQHKKNELLVGVVSGKNFDKTSIFTRVASFHEWINRGLATRVKLSFVTLTINYLLLSLYLRNTFLEINIY